MENLFIERQIYSVERKLADLNSRNTVQTFFFSNNGKYYNVLVFSRLSGKVQSTAVSGLLQEIGKHLTNGLQNYSEYLNRGVEA